MPENYPRSFEAASLIARYGKLSMDNMEDQKTFFTKSQVRFIIVTFVAAITTGVGYWQWPRHNDVSLTPINILIDEWVRESEQLREDFDDLKVRVQRINVLQAVVLERWKVQNRINASTDDRLDRQERK